MFFFCFLVTHFLFLRNKNISDVLTLHNSRHYTLAGIRVTALMVLMRYVLMVTNFIFAAQKNMCTGNFPRKPFIY